MGFWSTLAKVGGAGVGFAVGGPAGALTGMQLGGGLADALGGGDSPSPSPTGGNRVNYDPKAAQAALDASSKAAATAALPAFKDQLQGIGESLQRRGVENGEVAGTYLDRAKGDFENRIANSIAAGAQDQYKTGLEVQAGNADRATAEENAQRAASSSRQNGLLGLLGTAAGAYASYRGRNSGGDGGGGAPAPSGRMLTPPGSTFDEALKNGFSRLRA